MGGRFSTVYVRRMYRFCTGYLHAALILLILSGLLAPRMTAVLAQVIPGVQTMVICTGDELIVLTIGTDGVPIETEDSTQHPCVMGDTISVAENTLPFWAVLGRDFAHHFAIHENAQADVQHLALISPTRAPPVLV